MAQNNGFLPIRPVTLSTFSMAPDSVTDSAEIHSLAPQLLTSTSALRNQGPGSAVPESRVSVGLTESFWPNEPGKNQVGAGRSREEQGGAGRNREEQEEEGGAAVRRKKTLRVCAGRLLAAKK